MLARGRSLLTLAPALAFACGPVVGVDDASSGASSETSATASTTTADSADSNVSSSSSSSSSSTTGSADDLDGVLDFGDFPETPDMPSGCSLVGPAGLPGENLPYLWVADAAAGTIFKLHTQALVIEGERATAPAPADPSSTSVALSGMVAVSNREGGVAAFHGSLDRCPNPASTSTGAGDVLPFGEDGCMAWYTPLPLASQGPVAWGQGLYDERRCEWADEWLWVVGVIEGETDQAVAYQLEGATGAVLAEIPLPSVGPGGTVPHAAVADDNSNLWVTPLGTGSLVRVDAQSLLAEAWPLPLPAVGLAFDTYQGVWSCGEQGLARFDVGSATFAVVDAGALGGPAEGCVSDGQHLWLGGGASLRGVGLKSWTLDVQWPVPEATHGVAVDFDRYVWTVGDTSLQRTDIRTGDVEVVPGIQSTTMSDMTGFQLAHVTD